MSLIFKSCDHSHKCFENYPGNEAVLKKCGKLENHIMTSYTRDDFFLSKVENVVVQQYSLEIKHIMSITLIQLNIFYLFIERLKTSDAKNLTNSQNL
jgi:hypothetical protein